MNVVAVDHIVLNVTDVAASADWYARVLGMTARTGPKGRTSLHFGQQKINLRPISATQAEWFTGRAPTPGSDDLCFLTDAGPEAVVTHLGDCGVAVEVGPTTKDGAMGEIRSVYCRDPDGNLVEIASYPEAASA